MERLYFALGAAVVVFLLVTAYRYFAGEMPSSPVAAAATAMKKEGFENQTSKCIFFGVDWCPHCVKAKPIFEELGPTQTIGGHVVQMEIINPETDENPYKDRVKVSGYPTVVFLDGEGNVTEYEGPRTREGFLSFLQERTQ